MKKGVMNKIKIKNKKVIRGLKSPLAFAVISYLSFSQSALSMPQDFISSTDLQDSPLSLSLTASANIMVGEQRQQVIVSQYGILNTTTINQSANSSNSIIVNQDGIANEVIIEQFGHGNSVNIQQQGDRNLANVIQEGDANTANIAQAGEQTFAVHQIGNEMVVNITQY